MVGINSLVKLLRRTLGPQIEDRGILPHRYYLHKALDALDADDIDEAVRMITLAALSKRKGTRWRLVCQQVVFRCRVLASLHEKQLDRIEAELQIFGKTQGIRDRYLRLKEREGKARDVLKKYELQLLNHLAGDSSSGAMAS